jgi:4-amino-4-deoxy-L-arabinose transferase-like glycosyltransferase
LGFGLVATAILLTRATIFEAIFMFPLVMLIPGVALAEFMIPTASPDEVLAMGFGLMVAISGLLSLLHELPSAYGTLSIGIATMVLLVFSAWRFMRSRLVSKISSADKFGLYCMLAAFFLAISIVLLPVHEGDVLFLMAPPYHTRMPFLPGDMVLPYRFAQFLVNHLDVYSTTFYCCDWHIYDRTPLMGMVGAYLLGLFRIDVVAAPVFWGASQQVLDKSGLYEFWSAGALLDASIILSGYLLIKTLFGQKVARLATVFLVLNPFILWNAFYTSPKSMAAYFVLLFYYCVVTRRHLPLAGVFAGLAVLSHAYALLFLPGGLLFLIMGHGSEIRKIPRMLALFVAVVAPWGLWAYALHTELGLFFRMLAGPSDLTAAVWTRIVNAYRTLSPWLFGLTASDTSNFFASQPTISADIRSHPILALVGLTYVWTLPGAVSLSLTTFSFAGLFGESRSKSRLVLLLVVLPFVFGVAITGGVYGGLAYVYCHPIVPILVAFGAVYLLQHGKKALNAAVGLGILAESLFVTWVMIYPYHLLVRLSSLFDLALLAMILLCYSAILLTLAHVLLESRQSAITYPDTTT